MPLPPLLGATFTGIIERLFLRYGELWHDIGFPGFFLDPGVIVLPLLKDGTTVYPLSNDYPASGLAIVRPVLRSGRAIGPTQDTAPLCVPGEAFFPQGDVCSLRLNMLAQIVSIPSPEAIPNEARKVSDPL